MANLSSHSTRTYDAHWKYLKTILTDINNVELTLSQINAIQKTVKGMPVTFLTRKNYLTAVIHQIRDNVELRKQYSPHMGQYIKQHNTAADKQQGTEKLRQKLDKLSWTDILDYKNKILESKTISDENKLLIRLYTELDAPVRNNFVGIRVFIDEGRPVDYDGNCIMLTTATIHTPRRKRVIKKSDSTPEIECSPDTVFMPVSNMIWLQQFKTKKTYGSIIQKIPQQLANDIITFCKSNNKNVLFNVTEFALCKRICSMFYQVSKRQIGINVMRHLFIMHKFGHLPKLETRKHVALQMGHSTHMQDLYRVITD